MLQLALKEAELVSSEGATPILGDALAELARQYILADSVINRLSRTLDLKALSAMAEGVEIRLDTGENARESAERLQEVLEDPALPGAVTVISEPAPTTATNELGEPIPAWRVVVRRMHHGNMRVSVFDRPFVRGADYATLARAAKTFLGLIGPGARIVRGSGDKRKEKYVADFREVMQWLHSEAERGVSKQRYKGLGEMNPDQLWETTMDPTARRLLRVQIEDAIAADEVFTTLMGDNVEPRRAFIEAHALQAGNIDV
jgi:DNA gyrase subunit B